MAMTRAEFTTGEAKERGNLGARLPGTAKGVPSLLLILRWFVARAGEDGQARVFGIRGIGGGALAEEERRAFGGFDGAGVKAGGAEASLRVGLWSGKGPH